MERSKYLYPAGPDGLLLTSSQEFEKEATRSEAMTSEKNVLIEFCDREPQSKWPKKLRFTKFTISNQFPNNVCILRSGSVVIVRDIVEHPPGSGELYVVGQKFCSLSDAFTEPFPSSKFKIFIASKLNQSLSGEWNIDCLAGKMYALPYKQRKNQSLDITDPNQKWYVSPLHHTLL